MARTPACLHAPVLWALAAAFALRVAGQALQRWLPQPFLPPFGQWQGSGTPYSLLLTLQLLIVALLVRTAWRVGRRLSTPSPRLGRQLAGFGAIYMAVSVARVAIGWTFDAAPPWFTAWISGVFHIVLAAYVLTVAHYHLQTSAGSR